MNIDFTLIKDLNPNRILFLDVSEYESSPISPTLHIKFPDFVKEYKTPIKFGELNILNTKMLQYANSNLEFPDGMYTFTFEIDNYYCQEKKNVFITTKAYSDLHEMLKTVEWDNKSVLEKINKINLYLQGAESVSDVSQANALYKQALTLLNCNNGMRMREYNTKQHCK